MLVSSHEFRLTIEEGFTVKGMGGGHAFLNFRGIAQYIFGSDDDVSIKGGEVG